MFRRFLSSLRERRGTEILESSVSRLLAALKESARTRDLARGKKAHADAIEGGHESNTYVATSLINMYAKCGSLEEAQKIFDKLPQQQNVFSWTALLSGYAENGQAEKALELFFAADDQTPNAHSFTAAIKACASLAAAEIGRRDLDGRRVVKLAALKNGMRVHSRAAKHGCVDIFVENSLLDMYSRCGSLIDARMVFDRMQRHDVISWTSILLGCSQNGEADVGFELFKSMRASSRCEPNAFTFVAALKACSLIASEEGLEKGRDVHAQAVDCGCESDLMVGSSLIEMYSSCGSLSDARKVFDRISIASRDVLPWNSMLVGFVQNGEASATLELFQRLQQVKIRPNSQSFVAAVKACSCLAASDEGRKLEALEKGIVIHSQAARSGFLSDFLVATNLIEMYSRCGEILEARSVFDSLQKRDVVLWTSLLLGYTQNGKSNLALQLYDDMLQSEGFLPDCQCFVTVLRACVHLATREDGSTKLALKKGMQIRSQAAKAGCDTNPVLVATLIDLFARCGSMDDARREFGRLEDPETISWTSLILGFAQNGQSRVALEEFSRMQLEGCAPSAQSFVAALKACSGLAADEESRNIDGKSVKVLSLRRSKAVHAQAESLLDIYIASSLIDLYSKCGSMIDAHRVFLASERNVVCWTALILGYVHNSQAEEALRLFEDLQTQDEWQQQADAQTFVAVLKACSENGAADVGSSIHRQVLRQGFFDSSSSSSELGNSLVDFYSKCGKMVEAQQVFDAASTRGIEIWSSLMGGYSRKGEVERVFEMFEEIQEAGLKPDGIVFTHLLTACSHGGLVFRGRECFRMMNSKKFAVNLQLEHYHGMIDLLGRSNRLDEALQFVQSMPLKPNAVTWMTLLSACRKWRNLKMAKVAFESLMKVDDKHVAGYVLMANIYASCQGCHFL